MNALRDPKFLIPAMLCIGLALRWLLREWRMRRGQVAIDSMSGFEFERFVASIFQRQGYRVAATPQSGDWGADLVLTRRGQTAVVQAKRWQRKIGVSAVQEVVASMPVYGAKRGFVVTNSNFTEAAQALAEVNGVELWDREAIQKHLRRWTPAGSANETQRAKGYLVRGR